MASELFGDSARISTRIGITFDVPINDDAIFSNGITQNVLFFYDLLSLVGYDVSLVVVDTKTDISTFFWNPSGRYRCTTFSKLVDGDFHLVIQFGLEIPNDVFAALSERFVKVVFYNCGNLYFIDSESCLFKSDSPAKMFYSKRRRFDQIWLSPQMMNTCKHYMETLYRCEVVEVPFIWSPACIELYEKKKAMSFEYKNRGVNKSIATFEPNLSLMKWCLPPVLVCENAFRALQKSPEVLDRNRIHHLYITNVPNNIRNMPAFTHIINTLDIHSAGKVSIESRYNSLYFMSKYADVVVSHQMENNLNYLYIDLAWMGWPVIHNAKLCADVGYYYDGFDYKAGGKLLQDTLVNHDLNAELYRISNRATIDRYLPTNRTLQESYVRLVNDVLSIGK